MIRKLTITLSPSEALSALSALHAPPRDVAAAPGTSAASAVFGARLGQEVARAFDAWARPLDVLGQCLDWLERRDVCSVERPRARAGAQREPTWRSPAELRVDVRALARDVAAEAEEPDSRARATAWALRAVLRHLASTSLHAADLRAGNERIPAAEALASYDTAMATAGFGPNAAPPPRLAHLAPRRGAAAKAPPVVEAPAPKVERPAAAAKPAAKPAPDPAPKREAPPAPAPKAGKKGAEKKSKPGANAGFGGLPDDAMPEDRRTGDVYGPRGLTLDAEFFLTEAGIAAWPCDVPSLEKGRRRVVTKLHPDRAGEASTSAFHRAIKGHAELLKKLTAAGAPAAVATPPPPAPAPVPAPDPTPAATVEAVAPAPARKPRTRKPRPDATTSQVRETAPAPAPPAPPVPSPAKATATTYEWPPRPPEPPPAKVVAAPPPTVSAPPPAPSHRGATVHDPLSDDAEFFVREARLSWPCDVGTLQKAWRAMSARYRRRKAAAPSTAAPDELTRVSRGYAKLLELAGARSA